MHIIVVKKSWEKEERGEKEREEEKKNCGD